MPDPNGIQAVIEATPVAGSTMERLQAMVRDLEHMERFLHSDDSPPPTIAEHRLYGLIIWHVKLYILMFYIERGSRFHQWPSCEKPRSGPSDENEELICLLLEVYCGKHSMVHRGCLSGEQVDQKVEHLWDLLIMFNGLLKKSRNHLSKLYSPPVVSSLQASCSEMEGKKIKDYEDYGINSREDYLLNILHGLEDIGRDRSYAPPDDGEIQFYQDIRKRVTSYLEFTEAKPGWQSLLRKWHSVTREAHGMEFWHSFYRGPSSYGVSYSPSGYRLATALDEFSDFLSILRECKCHFFEIHSFLCTEDKLIIVDNISNKGREDKDTLDSISCGAAVPDEYDKEVVKGSKGSKKTREQYLRDILVIFEKMGPLKMDTQLQIVEVRLYAQIIEHVTSSIWMYDTLQGGKIRWEGRCDPIDGESAADTYDHSDYVMASDESTTREKCLIKIVQLVESIRSSFLDSPPTEQEIGHYKEIQTQLNTDMLNLKISGIEGDKNHKSLSSVSASPDMWKQLLRFVYDWELILLKEVEDDLRELVRSIYARLLEHDAIVDPLKFVEDYFNNHKLRERAIYDLADPFLERPNGLKVLDRLILILTKLETLFDSFLCTLRSAHKYMDSLMAREMNKEIALEVSSALEVMRLHQSSPLVSRNFWGRCRALEVSVPTTPISLKDKTSYRALEVSIPVASRFGCAISGKYENRVFEYQSCTLRRSRSF